MSWATRLRSIAWVKFIIRARSPPKITDELLGGIGWLQNRARPEPNTGSASCFIAVRVLDETWSSRICGLMFPRLWGTRTRHGAESLSQLGCKHRRFWRPKAKRSGVSNESISIVRSCRIYSDLLPAALQRVQKGGQASILSVWRSNESWVWKISAKRYPPSRNDRDG